MRKEKKQATLLQALLPVFIFCGHQVSVTLKNTTQKNISTYYIRDVLLTYLHKYFFIFKRIFVLLFNDKTATNRIKS